jgi:hypothetical protein
MRRRAGLAIVLVAALGVVAFVTCGPVGDDSAGSRAADDDARATTDGEAPRPRRRAPAAADPSADTPQAARESTEAMPQVEGFPAIDVEVRHATGAPAPSVTVYALPAGAPGRWVASSGPHATTDEDGRCRLPLARVGSFDVGAVQGPHQSLARDVTAPRREPLVITLPPTGELVIVATERVAAPLDPARPTTLCVATTTFGKPGSVPVPGRDDVLQWAGTAEIPKGAHEVRVELPANLDLTIDGEDGLVAVPEKFRAPALVHVDRQPRYYAHLSVAVEPWNAVPEAEGWLVIGIDPGLGASDFERRIFARVRRGATLASQVDVTKMLVRVGGPDGAIRWSGHGVAEGEIEFTGLEPHRMSEFAIVARWDGRTLLAEDPRTDLPPPPTRFRVLDSDSTKPVLCIVASGPGGGAPQRRLPGEVVEASLHGEVWIAATRLNEVAGPVRAKAGDDALNEIPLVPGGNVVVQLDTAPPPALGPVTVGLRDEGMLIVGTGLRRRVDISHAPIIGPMPPGTYALVVRIGDQEVAGATATVRANETTTLEIPSLAPR